MKKKVSSSRIIISCNVALLSFANLLSIFNLVLGKYIPNYPPKTPEEIKDILIKSKIIPDVLPAATPGLMKVAYGEKIVDFGNNLTKSDTWTPPTYVDWEAEPKSYYCLIMIDPDFPGASFKSGHWQWQHWKVGNIPGTDISKGHPLADYIGVQAPKGTGMHRYVFVVYKQLDGKTKFDEFHLLHYPSDNLRANFSTQEFAELYNFAKNPVAVNYFMSEWDEYPDWDNPIGDYS